MAYGGRDVSQTMNRIRSILAIASVSLLLVAPALSQEPPASILASIERAFIAADADSIARMSASRVEIAVLGKSRLYSRTQARYVLRDFFDEYPPLRVELSEPSITDKGIFAAGTYRFAPDRNPLRLYVRLRRDQTTWLMREIVLERAVR